MKCYAKRPSFVPHRSPRPQPRADGAIEPSEQSRSATPACWPAAAGRSCLIPRIVPRTAFAPTSGLDQLCPPQSAASALSYRIGELPPNGQPSSHQLLSRPGRPPLSRVLNTSAMTFINQRKVSPGYTDLSAASHFACQCWNASGSVFFSSAWKDGTLCCTCPSPILASVST